MELNEAIFKVMNTQFKKDMGEALKIVEGAGYVVEKWDGRFYVKNPKTDKDLCVRSGYKGYNIFGNGDRKCRIDYGNKCLMDLVAYLEKPLNREWYKAQAIMSDWRSPTYYKCHRLKDAKWYIKYEKEQIEKVKKEIVDLQTELEKAIRAQIRYEQNLKEVRKDLGLEK